MYFSHLADFISHQQQLKQRLEALMQAQTETQNMLHSFMRQVDKRAIMQWSEQHRQKFRSLTPSETGNLFAFGQQLQDSCENWLLAEDLDTKRIVEQVVMEQFVRQLPEETVNWVQHHQPETLNEAIQLAENHLACFTTSQHLPTWECYFIMDSSRLIEIINQLFGGLQWQKQHLEALMQAQALTCLHKTQALTCLHKTQNMLQSIMQEFIASKKAIMQWSEQHRQKFRSLSPHEVGHLFTFGQQLQENCEKWLLAEDCDPRRIVDHVAMEQFVMQLPEEISSWVQHHQPETLKEAIQLAESQLGSFIFLQHVPE